MSLITDVHSIRIDGESTYKLKIADIGFYDKINFVLFVKNLQIKFVYFDVKKQKANHLQSKKSYH